MKWLVFLLIVPTVTLSQDIDDFRSWNDHHSCNNPANSDHWKFRDPTIEEVLEHGAHIRIFEYYNSPKGCSDDMFIGVYDGPHYFQLEVTTGGQDVDHMERVVLTTPSAPFRVRNTLLISDSPEAGIIILEPLTS